MRMCDQDGVGWFRLLVSIIVFINTLQSYVISFVYKEKYMVFEAFHKLIFLI